MSDELIVTIPLWVAWVAFSVCVVGALSAGFLALVRHRTYREMTPSKYLVDAILDAVLAVWILTMLLGRT